MNKFKFIKLSYFYRYTMKPNQDYSYIFDFIYNKLNFTMLLSHNEEDMMNLYFVKVGTQEELLLDIDDSFSIETFAQRDLYDKLISFFEIKYDPNNTFKPFNLFKYIDENSKPRKFNTTQNRETVTRLYKLNNPDAIYYHSMINWNRSKSGKRYSKENRDKVKKLLPNLFEIIKDKNISVRFTDQPKNAELEKIQYLDDLNIKSKNN